MFDEEVDAAALDKKSKAAEYAYGWDRDHLRAAKRAEEILSRIWDRESDLDLRELKRREAEQNEADFVGSQFGQGHD